MGIPPATLASNFKATPCCSARFSSNSKCTASRSLFAVMTCFFLFKDSLNQSTVGSIPPITSITISISSSFKISLMSSVK